MSSFKFSVLSLQTIYDMFGLGRGCVRSWESEFEIIWDKNVKKVVWIKISKVEFSEKFIEACEWFMIVREFLIFLKGFKR